MPTDLRAMTAQIQKTGKGAPKGDAPSPKFFDKDRLTGQGRARKTGLLSATADPSLAPEPPDTPQETVDALKAHYKNGPTETWRIPVNPLSAALWADDVRRLPLPDPHDSVKLATFGLTQPGKPDELTVDLVLAMEPHCLLVSKTKTPGATRQNTRTDLLTTYQLITYLVPTGDDVAPSARRILTTPHVISDVTTAEGALQSMVSQKRQGREVEALFCPDYFTARPQSALKGLKRAAEAIATNRTVYSLKGPITCTWYTDEVKAWFEAYSLHSHLSKLAEVWTEKLEDVLSLVLENLDATSPSSPRYTPGSTGRRMALNSIARLVTSWEEYPVPLERYRAVYDRIEATLAPDEVVAMSKQNMCLRFANYLTALKAAKPSLPKIAMGTASPSPQLNTQQRRAVESDEPLVLTLAGAGTGKSRTLKDRILYMEAAGIDPSTILALSFTNAAADHITEIAPKVHSMTIDKMIHLIYTLNFPKHALSQLGTLINSISYSYAHQWTSFADAFVRRLRALARSDKSAMTALANFVERHYDEVIATLDEVGLTTLELEELICYLKLETLKEPAEVRATHILVDEVQDNSVFQFVYILKYVESRRTSLYLTGDASQTLFEFRYADPKALNVLEMSDVFTTYNLTTNYRSNQEILDFANTQLAKIEANRFAQIQLSSNDRRVQDPVTADTFESKVRLEHTQLKQMSLLPQAIRERMEDTFVPWATEELKAGRTVACLAYSRLHVKIMEEAILKLFPGRHVASLVPERNFDQTLLSAYIERYWEAAGFIPTKALAATIAADVMSCLPSLTRQPDKAKPHLQRLLSSWMAENGRYVESCVAHAQAGLITQTECLDLVRRTLILTENEANSAKQSLLAQKNALRKERAQTTSPDFIVSTIHSAKGLEFDSVCVLYNAGTDQLSEEAKRLYYVALTRAMESELVLAFSTHASPKIAKDYGELKDTLERADIARKIYGRP